MNYVVIAVVAITFIAGCASDPARRAQVAAQESARLSPPTIPLSAYSTFELRPMAMGPEVAKDEAKAAVAKDLEGRLQSRVRPLFDDWNTQGTNRTGGGKTLIVQPHAMRIPVIGGATRFFAGAFAGESSIDMDLELRDASTGAVIARPRIIRNAGAMAGAWSIGATDRNLLDYIADIATQYLRDHRK